MPKQKYPGFDTLGQTDLDLWFLVLLRKLMAWVAHVWELGEHHGEPEGEAIALSHSVD